MNYCDHAFGIRFRTGFNAPTTTGEDEKKSALDETRSVGNNARTSSTTIPSIPSTNPDKKSIQHRCPKVSPARPNRIEENSTGKRGQKQVRVATPTVGVGPKIPTLLKLHQRVIDAALREISRPRQGPFENLGERLGGEHEDVTYCSSSIKFPICAAGPTPQSRCWSARYAPANRNRSSRRCWSAGQAFHGDKESNSGRGGLGSKISRGAGHAILVDRTVQQQMKPRLPRFENSSRSHSSSKRSMLQQNQELSSSAEDERGVIQVTDTIGKSAKVKENSAAASELQDRSEVGEGKVSPTHREAEPLCVRGSWRQQQPGLSSSVEKPPSALKSKDCKSDHRDDESLLDKAPTVCEQERVYLEPHGKLRRLQSQEIGSARSSALSLVKYHSIENDKLEDDNMDSVLRVLERRSIPTVTATLSAALVDLDTNIISGRKSQSTSSTGTENDGAVGDKNSIDASETVDRPPFLRKRGVDERDEQYMDANDSVYTISNQTTAGDEIANSRDDAPMALQQSRKATTRTTLDFVKVLSTSTATESIVSGLLLVAATSDILGKKERVDASFPVNTNRMSGSGLVDATADWASALAKGDIVGTLIESPSTTVRVSEDQRVNAPVAIDAFKSSRNGSLDATVDWARGLAEDDMAETSREPQSVSARVRNEQHVNTPLVINANQSSGSESADVTVDCASDMAKRNIAGTSLNVPAVPTTISEEQRNTPFTDCPNQSSRGGSTDIAVGWASALADSDITGTSIGSPSETIRMSEGQRADCTLPVNATQTSGSGMTDATLDWASAFPKGDITGTSKEVPQATIMVSEEQRVNAPLVVKANRPSSGGSADATVDWGSAFTNGDITVTAIEPTSTTGMKKEEQHVDAPGAISANRFSSSESAGTAVSWARDVANSNITGTTSEAPSATARMSEEQHVDPTVAVNASQPSGSGPTNVTVDWSRTLTMAGIAGMSMEQPSASVRVSKEQRANGSLASTENPSSNSGSSDAVVGWVNALANGDTAGVAIEPSSTTVVRSEEPRVNARLVTDTDRSCGSGSARTTVDWVSAVANGDIAGTSIEPPSVTLMVCKDQRVDTPQVSHANRSPGSGPADVTVDWASAFAKGDESGTWIEPLLAPVRMREEPRVNAPPILNAKQLSGSESSDAAVGWVNALVKGDISGISTELPLETTPSSQTRRTADKINGSSLISTTTSSPPPVVLNVARHNKSVSRNIEPEVKSVAKTPTLPPALLTDLLAFGGSTLKKIARKPQKPSVENEEQEKRLANKRAKAEEEERAEELSKLESLIYAEGLDAHPIEGLLQRGEVYGEGKHSVVYGVELRFLAVNEQHQRDSPTPKVEDVCMEEFDAMTTKQSAVKGQELVPRLIAETVVADIISTATSRVKSVTIGKSIPIFEARLPVLEAKKVLVDSAVATVMHVISREGDLAAATIGRNVPKESPTAISMAFAAKEFRYVRAEAPAAVLRNARREACMHLRVRSCERVIALCGIWLTPRLTLLLEAMDAGSFHHFIRRRALDRGDDENGRAVLDQEGGHKVPSRRKSARRVMVQQTMAQLVAQAAEGLAALHGAGIVHRDVKSHNVMMTNYNMPSSEIQERPLCEAKLGDLGSAAVLPTEGDSMLREEIGTSGWVAPEVRNPCSRTVRSK